MKKSQLDASTAMYCILGVSYLFRSSMLAINAPNCLYRVGRVEW